MLFLGLGGGLAYAAYKFQKIKALAPKRKSSKPLINLQSKKHWPSGEKIKLVDDGTYKANLFKVAGNTFGDYANYNCVAYLFPEIENEKHPNIAVYVDGLRVGDLSNRHVLSLYSVLQQAKLLFSATSCDAHIGGGGTGLDGKKLPYLITLDINWF